MTKIIIILYLATFCILTILHISIPKEVLVRSRVQAQLEEQRYECANQIKNYLIKIKQ